MSEPSVTGELVVRNGKRRGTRLPLTLPVTVVGAADRCDVRLTAPSVGDVHCLIAATPAGPTLRSWFPGHTLLNGQPTAAAVLKDGDEIKVGPCVFQLCWHEADPIPLAVAADPSETVAVTPEEFAALRSQAAAVAAQQAVLVEHEWQLRDRAHDLHEQETQLAAVLGDRHRQLGELHAQLAAGREQLRLDREAQAAAVAAQREKVRRMRSRVAPLHRQARLDRQKARKLLARFLGHMKVRWAAERRAVAADRADLDRCRRAFDDQVKGFQADQTKFRAEAVVYQKRLKDAWELLNEGQRRLLADRQQAEKTVAERTALLDTRTRDVEAREHALDAGRTAAEVRIRDLIAEGDRLEARTIRAREVLAELEAKRAGLLAADAVAVGTPDVVYMDRRADGASPERVFAELQAREHDLTRERHQIAAAKAELDRRAAELHDERSVVAEQVAMLTVVRDRLHADQRQALADLETVARGVHARELQVTARERSAVDSDRRNRRREAELVQFRLRLDGWQASLTAHEQTAAVARDRTDADLAARRLHLERWEAALKTLCRKWADARARERAALHAELARLTAARGLHEDGLAVLDRKRADLLTQAAAVAEQQIAAEQVRSELAAGGNALDRTATQRLRVLRRKWESHFTKYRAELDARRSALAAETAALAERTAAVHAEMVEAAHRKAVAIAAENALDAARLVRERELDERAAVLSIETARAKRTEEALALVRDEVERVAAAVMSAGPDTIALPAADRLPHGVVALRVAA